MKTNKNLFFARNIFAFTTKKNLFLFVFIEVSDAFFNNEYFEYDEFIQCTMHPRVQLSVAIRFHSLPLAALGKYIFSPHGKLELFALFVVENEAFGTSET